MRQSAGVAEADVVLMLCDGQEGPTAADEEIIQWLRREHSGKKVILAVNKCESSTQGEYQAALFWEYGHEPLAISAISGTGTGVLMERLIEVWAHTTRPTCPRACLQISYQAHKGLTWWMPMCARRRACL